MVADFIIYLLQLLSVDLTLNIPVRSLRLIKYMHAHYEVQV
jgi:hypothetical protein